MEGLDSSTRINDQPPCCICGENHLIQDCSLIKITNHVRDNEVPTKAKLTLPNSLQLIILVDGSYSILTKKIIEKGTKFGPIEAKKSETLNPDVVFPLKIFPTTGDELFLDTTNENECNWMMFVKFADFTDDQNLICYQENDCIYYLAIQQIQANSPLKVWYSPFYAKKMNKDVLTSQPQEDILKNIDLNSLIKKQQKIMERKNWTCKFCSKVETDIITFANHMRKHYLAQLKNICEICNHSFYSRKSLKNHLKIVHNSHQSGESKQRNKPIQNKINNNNNSNRDSTLGDPLLNDLFSDSLDNSNLILQQTDLNQFDMNSIDNQNLLLDTDNLNMENLLNEGVKELDHFNFEIDDNQKQYVCDICLKQFSKLKLLVLHLKHHTAEHTCYKCLKIFCRKENFLTHSCNSPYKFQCTSCCKSFPQRKYLIRHLQSVHYKKYKCLNCNKCYCSKKELTEHNCSKVANADKEKFICSICNKVFFRDIYLKKHLKTHAPKTDSTKDSSSTICEICGVFLLNKNSCYMHMKKHAEPTHKCESCNRKFYRKDLLESHKKIHQESKCEFECSTCHKKFKSRKTLYSHKFTHDSTKSHQCSLCQATFKHRSNLNLHFKKKHKSDRSDFNIEHFKYFICPICKKSMKLRSSLIRHLRKTHPGSNIDFTSIKPTENSNSKSNKNPTNQDNCKNDRKKISNDAEKRKFSNDLNLDDILNDGNAKNNLSDNNLIAQSNQDNVDGFIKDLGSIEKVIQEENQTETEVCLSIPDLTENDQEITLGKNAYILENGTIVQPQENSDRVVIYVLNQNFPINK